MRGDLDNGPETIFVADDDEAVCELLKMVIDADGLKVRTWATADAFLAEREREFLQPGCLLHDLELPKVGGLELVDELQKRDVKLLVIFLSGRGDLLASAQARCVKTQGYFRKPFDNTLLLSCIRRVIGRAETAHRSS